jgi:hypothetical protein
MKELEISVDTGNNERKIIISSGIISLEKKENSISSKYQLSTIVIAGNGAFAPPFTKGSRILQDLRDHSHQDFSSWKLVFPLLQNEFDFFKIPHLNEEFDEELKIKENWGIWFCESNSAEIPNILILNFPLWKINSLWGKVDFNKDLFSEILSFIYRTILSALSTTLSFLPSLENNLKPGILAFSDLGNNLIDKNLISGLSKKNELTQEIPQLRIRVFTQVLSEWLLKNDNYNKIAICYGDGFHEDSIERAWDTQVYESKNETAEFGEALLLRKRNVAFMHDLIQTVKNKHFKNALQMAVDTLSSEKPFLSADLIQCRTLVEAISHELCIKYDLKAKSANLFAYIERIEESKKVSPWVTSYLHVIRQLGNEAAHYKNEFIRRPEKPVGKDLIVIHAALNRILAFCMDEDL